MVVKEMADDEIQYHNLVVLTNETAKQLYEMLSKEYISYEHSPKVIELMKVLREKFHNG